MANAQQSKTNKSRDSQPTANHAISFTRRPGQLSRSNNQTNLKQNNNPIRTQCRFTSIWRNREHQSHECLQSFHSPRSILRDSSVCDLTTGEEDVLSHNRSNEKWHARAILPMASSSRSAPNTTPTSKWHRASNMGFHTWDSCYSKLSSDENVEEVADPSSSELLSRTIAERHTSPRSGDKLSPDAEFMSSKSSWTNTVLHPVAKLLHGAFVLVLAKRFDRCCRGRWGHTCPTGTPTICFRVTHWLLEHVLFPQRIVSLLSSPLRSNSYTGEEESAEGSVFLSNVPTPSCHTELYHDVRTPNPLSHKRTRQHILCHCNSRPKSP